MRCVFRPAGSLGLRWRRYSSLGRWALGLAICSSAPACAGRVASYQFTAPLIGGVRAADIPPLVPDRSAPELPSEPERQSDGRSTALAAARPAAPLRTGTRAPLPALRRDRASAAPPRQLLIPARPLTGAPETLARKLRALVGERRDETPVRFAVRALRAIGARPDRDLGSADDGGDLLAVARTRDAIDSSTPPLLGDLVVFDRVHGNDEASLVGVVIGTDSAGTVEFVYLSGGVVRRGFLNRNQPERKRDDSGRALNTIVRPLQDDDARDRDTLAGELFRDYIRLDRLVL
jgi:hypothetical protein